MSQPLAVFTEQLPTVSGAAGMLVLEDPVLLGAMQRTIDLSPRPGCPQSMAREITLKPAG